MTLSDVFGAISDAAGSGSQSTGSIASVLIQGGLSLAAISEILNQVATNANATPDMVAYAQAELQHAAQQYYQPRTNPLVWVALGLGALWLMSDNR